MRMGVEEAWAQMCQTHGTAAAKERVDRAREALSEHYHTLRESLSQQRTELEEARTSLRGERDEFRNERQTLTEWITERDEELRLREEQLRKEAGELQSQEAEWQAIQERWIHEKVEAEEIIRDLLGQLTEITSPSPTAHSEPITPTQTPPGDWAPAARADASWEAIDPQTPTDPRD
jgi:chromosome segregation ATPase